MTRLRNNNKIILYLFLNGLQLTANQQHNAMQTPVLGIRLDPLLAVRVDKAVANNTHKKNADIYREILSLGLHALEAENYDLERALVRSVMGMPASDAIALANQSRLAADAAESKPSESSQHSHPGNKRRVSS